MGFTVSTSACSQHGSHNKGHVGASVSKHPANAGAGTPMDATTWFVCHALIRSDIHPLKNSAGNRHGKMAALEQQRATMDGHKRLRRNATPTGAVRLLWCLSMFCAATASAAWEQIDTQIMGTTIQVQAWHADPSIARRGIEAVVAEMHRIDAQMSTYKDDSELSRINTRAAEQTVPVSDELAALIARALEFSELTEGAFDVTYASVGYLYDFRLGVHPDARSLEEALPGVNFRHVILDRERGTVAFDRKGVRIDLGGIAKGYAVERGADILRAHGIEHAQIGAGGDTRLLGDRRGRPWIVGVRDPRDRSRIVAQLPLVDEAISTSGDYERYFEQEGQRFHHIIDPGTGTSARGVRSVSIIGPDATLTDALSTGVFVMGVEQGLELVNRLTGVEAVIVDGEGRLWFSAGLERVQRSD
jgi:thiamine biosynthesis lipoprotein